MHKSKEYIPYNYLIGWSIHNKWYYGEQHCNTKYNIANPENLWNTYFTSSNYVTSFRQKYGEPDIIQIRKTFKTAQDSLQWETKVLQRIKAKFRDDFLNKHDNISIFHDEEIRDKISKANTGRFKNKTYEEIHGVEKANILKKKRSISSTGKNHSGHNNPMYGKKHSDETIQKQREIRLRDAHRGDSHHYTGKQRDQETKLKISKTLGHRCTDGTNVFNSIKEMAQFHNTLPQTIQYRIKANNTIFKLLH